MLNSPFFFLVYSTRPGPSAQQIMCISHHAPAGPWTLRGAADMMDHCRYGCTVLGVVNGPVTKTNTFLPLEAE